jgi:hypothetical protein
MIMMFRTRSGFLGSPRQLGELHVGAEWPRDIVLPRLVYFETFLVRTRIDNLGGVAIATVGGLLSLR